MGKREEDVLQVVTGFPPSLALCAHLWYAYKKSKIGYLRHAYQDFALFITKRQE